MEDEHLISLSTLYVSLEPCNIFKNTPPCTQFIIANKIPKVVVSCLDINPEISGLGIAELQRNGIETLVGVLEDEGKMLTRFRDTFLKKRRPYIILKYALSKEGYFCPSDRTTFWFSNLLSKKQVHHWRSESHAILIGSGTLLSDDPLLNVRLVEGKNPAIVVLAQNTILPSYLKIFSTGAKILIFSSLDQVVQGDQITVIDTSLQPNFLQFVMDQLFKQNIFILLVEGGLYTIEKLLENKFWDEARIIFTPTPLTNGIKGFVPVYKPFKTFELNEDKIALYQNI
jgi:diaminohydroxyphosphoribosylaminopyrimidine deaminase/5-amino-6-(5-phosphoribosylamino)uracil reductase